MVGTQLSQDDNPMMLGGGVVDGSLMGWSPGGYPRYRRRIVRGIRIVQSEGSTMHGRQPAPMTHSGNPTKLG